ncbi:hypothetical protein ACFQWF_21335 [Methylorubrum suomiense]
MTATQQREATETRFLAPRTTHRGAANLDLVFVGASPHHERQTPKRALNRLEQRLKTCAFDDSVRREIGPGTTGDHRGKIRMGARDMSQHPIPVAAPDEADRRLGDG